MTKLEKNKLEYKTGYSWIGDIPKDWQVNKFKIYFKLSNERASINNFKVYSLTMKGLKERDISTNEGQLAASYENYARLKVGDIVLNPMDLVSGFIDCAKREGIISPAYTILRERTNGSINLNYVKYFLQWHYYFKIFFPFGKGVSVDHRWTLSNEELLTFPLIIPPTETQKRIVNYLDKETDKIIKIIEKKEQVIRLFKEKKMSVISKIVTKGLDAKVKMKDSGIEWIGEIPEDWDVFSIKKIFLISRGRVIAKTELDPDGLYPVYSSQTKREGVLGKINTYDYDQDLLTWTTDGALAGTIFKRTGKFNCTNVCGMLIPKRNDLILNYLLYSVQHCALENKRPDTNGAKIMSNEMKRIKICFPPAIIQKQIGEYLDEFVFKIDKVIKNSQTQIKELKEYKSSLIYNAVTGKIKI